MYKILVVEPESVLLNILAELLDLYGFYPLITTSFEQGLELNKREKPDLILCGHSSKYINSYEACWIFLQKLRQDPETANTPFIFMAGSDLSIVYNWQNYLTDDQILIKPFNTQIFIETIYHHLQNDKKKANLDTIHQLLC